MDEYGGVLEVQGLWVNIGFPMGGTPLGESDWHNHIQATWGKKREGQLGNLIMAVIGSKQTPQNF